MLTFVLIINGVITLFNCYLVWQLLKLRKTWHDLANQIEQLNQKALIAFPFTLWTIRRGEYQTLKIRQKSQTVQQKWQKLLTLVQLLTWLYKQIPLSGVRGN